METEIKGITDKVIKLGQVAAVARIVTCPLGAQDLQTAIKAGILATTSFALLSLAETINSLPDEKDELQR